METPLKTLFLRCFLHNQKLMFISRTKLLEYASVLNMGKLRLMCTYSFFSVFRRYCVHARASFCAIDTSHVTCTYCTVHVGTKELDEFLSIFLNCGSLFCSPDGAIPFLNEYVILDPPTFIQEMDTLYYLEFHAKSHPAGLHSEVSCCYMYNYLCRHLLGTQF